MRKITFVIAVLFTVFYSCETVNRQPLTVAQIFGDNMVIQANKKVNVWGTATVKSSIEVQFRNQKKAAVVGVDGKWKVVLEPENYGKSDSLVIVSDQETIVFNNVLVGEVWVCSGQSNMELPLISNWASINNAQEEVKNANYPDLRLLTVNKSIAFQPMDTASMSGWSMCDSNTVGSFSATAYFFGREIHEKLGVPVGLIHTSWGGTVAEAWTSTKSLLKLSDFADKTKKISELNISMDSMEAKYKVDVEIMNQQIAQSDKGIEGNDTVYATKKIDISDWLTVDLPIMWEETALGSFDGSGWFIKEVDITKEMADSELTLCYGAPDDWDEAWINGKKVGESKKWDVLRKYSIPKGIVETGKNTIVIRIMDGQGGGGFMNEEKDFVITSSTGKSIPIAKGWKVSKGFDFKDIKTIPISAKEANQPTVLFNSMINPIIPFTMQGVIWYQGESNSGQAFQYRKLFKTLITDWRTEWKQGDFPFLFVQLANYLKKNTTPVEDTWAELREAQTMALELPNTGMAVAIDIGDALDIHPGNKQDVGKRLAYNALANVYNKDIPYSGPMYESMNINGSKIEITFKFKLDGLQTSDSTKLIGFAIAGDDKKFVWADAEITENKVIVYSPKIKNPVAVRYGWASNPDCNLINSVGLPASPFRTDTWKGITE